MEFQSKLTAAIQSQKPFVLFRKPQENQIGLYVQDFSGSNRFLMHTFDAKMEKSISDENPIYISVDTFDFNFEIQLVSKPLQPSISKEDYEKLIQKTIEEIRDSEIQKIVISRIKSIENKEYNLIQSFLKLVKNHPNALVYLWHNPDEETWIGATPELLLSQKENTVQTVSLAGTKLPENHWTQKEIDEQKFVTDYISTQFSELKNLKISEVETVQAGKFQHLKTNISAEITADFDLKKLVKNLHPTPAVCGLPKREAFDFIVRYEGYDRGFYTGYLGIESKDSKEYFVNLRSAQIFKNQIQIYVGGGITAESQPEKEWEETELKSGTIIHSLIK